MSIPNKSEVGSQRERGLYRAAKAALPQNTRCIRMGATCHLIRNGANTPPWVVFQDYSWRTGLIFAFLRQLVCLFLWRPLVRMSSWVHVLSRNVLDLQSAVPEHVPNEVVSDIDVFASLMENRVLRQFDWSEVVSENRDTPQALES